MLRNYITMHSAKNMKMKASTTQSLGLYELKKHKPWFHEEYLQPLVQRKQAKIQFITAVPTKAEYRIKRCKALSSQAVQEKKCLKAKINELETDSNIKNISVNQNDKLTAMSDVC
jgi:ribosomal protein S3AE